eukprot:m.334925 g.334925  ORF g.334925 m.334925 type:complete len:109 (+) comp17467_c0_seq1:40-366(+)
MAHHLNYTVAALVGAGGIAGYVKKKSIPSLAAGVGCGLLYGLSGYLISNGSPDRGHQVGAVVSLVLVGATGPRALRTKKFMPAGLVALIGTAAGIYNAKKAYEWEYGV